MGKIGDLHNWWERLTTIGPGFGYFPNAAKTWLVTKEGYHDSATSTFANTGMNNTNGRPYIVAAIGSKEYVKEEVESKVKEWITSVKCLAKIAETQPHAAFSALTHGMMAKWTYLSHTIPGIDPLLRPLHDAMWSTLLPALTGRPPPSVLEHSLCALPVRLGGLGIGIPSKRATHEFHSSFLVTSTLYNHILSQDHDYGYDIIAKQIEESDKKITREPLQMLMTFVSSYLTHYSEL